MYGFILKFYTQHCEMHDPRYFIALIAETSNLFQRFLYNFIPNFVKKIIFTSILSHSNNILLFFYQERLLLHHKAIL